MDVNDYISSGILEAYVLGGLSDKERQEVECMSSIYEEIRQELQRLQAGFEAVAKTQAVNPPDALKQSILEAIDSTPQDHRLEETPVIPLNADQKTSPTLWRAAAIILVVVSAGLGYLYSTKNGQLNEQSQQLATLDQAVTEKDSILSAKQAKLTQINALNTLISDKSTQQVVMPGTEVRPDAGTRVFYNPSKDQIALQIDFLPETAENQQYQLWAIIDGQPTDMGVLENMESNKIQLVDYAFGTPDAFAITLEKAGGSDTPDLSNLYVIGNV